MRDATYAVNVWGSRPDAGNDDCWTGLDLPRDEALALFNLRDEELAAILCPREDAHTAYAYVELDGPDLHRVRPNALYDAEAVRRRREADDAAWRSEIACQAGMGGGCEAYNDAMGWEVDCGW